jgi:hypothetical protein
MIRRSADQSDTTQAANGDPDPEISATYREAVDRLTRRMADLHHQKFFGEVKVEIREGELNLIEIRQTIKPKDL